MHLVVLMLRKEWVTWFRDRRLVIVIATVLTLVLAATALGWLRQREAARDRSAATQHDREIWLAQGAVNPHSAAHFGQFAFKPVSALSLFDPGLSAYLGEAVWIEAHYQNPAQARRAEAEVLLARFGDFSAAWLLQVLLPLLAILLGFGNVAMEREHGTLRLMFAQGASPARVILAKSLALFSLLLGVVVVVLGVAFGAAVAGGGVAVSTDDWLRTGGLLAAYTSYAAIWTVIAIGVSAVLRETRAALLLLLAFWIGATVLLPRFAAGEADRRHPLPDAGAFWAAVAEAQEQGVDGHSPRSARTLAFREEVLARYNVKTVAELPVSFTALSLQAGEEHTNGIFDRYFGDLQDRLRAQAAVIRGHAALSPTLALQALSSALAGTDTEHHAAFMAQVEQERRTIQRELNGDFARNARGREFNYKAGRELWEKVLAQEAVRPALGALAGQYRRDLAVTAGWGLAAGLLLLAAGRRLGRLV